VAREAEAARKAELAAREAEAARKAEIAAREAEAARKSELAAREAELELKAEQAARKVELARKAEAAAAAKEIEAARRAEAAARKEAAAAREEAAEVALAARAAATAAAEASAAADLAAKAAAQAKGERPEAPDALSAPESDTGTPDRGAGEGPVASSTGADAATIADQASDEGADETDIAALSAREARERKLAAAARKAEKAVTDDPIAVIGSPVRVRALGPAGGEPLIGHLVRIEEGDTIWDIAVAHYGDAGPSTFERVLASNPGIRNANRLSVGAFIYMPFQNPDQMIRRDGENGYRVLVSAAPNPGAVEDARTWARSVLKDRVEFGTAADTSDSPAVYELYAVGLPDHDAAFDVAVRVLSEYGRVRGGKRQTAQR
jgi:phage tail protein X